ncbi:MAG: hypothetical protein CMJ75_20720 [Planctomycetaceae bacterium]|nr:hypothetical protein [Planctomycetaceae bacterium]
MVSRVCLVTLCFASLLVLPGLAGCSNAPSGGQPIAFEPEKDNVPTTGTPAPATETVENLSKPVSAAADATPDEPDSTSTAAAVPVNSEAEAAAPKSGEAVTPNNEATSPKPEPAPAEQEPSTEESLGAADPENATPPATPAESATPEETNTSDEANTSDGSTDNTVAARNAREEEHPFPERLPAPDFPKDAEWLNTNGPLRLRDLRGKFVLLDFWTYCCINCMHILPELKKLEHAYPNELVVIGVHAAKFETEKNAKNIEEAILRYEIEHPVVNDPNHLIWNSFGARSWPTIAVIDPEGAFIGRSGGEFVFEQLDGFFKRALPYYKKHGLLDPSPVRFELAALHQQNTPLRFPGKVLADEAGQRLFITDSNHNRLVITDLSGKLLDIIGTGSMGRKDGGYQEASFDHPQGVALHGEVLYVADTENHLLRKIDLKAKQVATIAGVGSQARGPWPGIDQLAPGQGAPERYVGKPETTPINSPWALWVHEDALYIAMAGPHQIWKMTLDESELGPFAGNGREDIVDGLHLPERPYDTERPIVVDGRPVARPVSSFAQPSGLVSDGQALYIADSEGSSIRAMPFDLKQEVRTLVGTPKLPYGRLFKFGDRDGSGLLRFADTPEDAQNPLGGLTEEPELDGPLLQHPLGVTYHEGVIYLTDTYNNKIKSLDTKSATLKTIAGTGEPGLADTPAQFDEPAGITYAAGKLYIADTNNHAIRVLELANGKVTTLQIDGLQAPTTNTTAKAPDFSAAKQVAVASTSLKPKDGKITLQVDLQLPEGWKINEQAPLIYYLKAAADAGPVDRSALGKQQVEKPAASFTVTLPVTASGDEQVSLSMNYFYCQTGGEGLCRVGSVVFTVPLQISDSGSEAAAKLSLTVPAPLSPESLPDFKP